jgi:hypothetical protein
MMDTTTWAIAEIMVIMPEPIADTTEPCRDFDTYHSIIL